jgi:hypothetical protein
VRIGLRARLRFAGRQDALSPSRTSHGFLIASGVSAGY